MVRKDWSLEKCCLCFNQILQKIRQSLKDQDETQVASAIKLIEKNEVNYNTLTQLLGEPMSPQDIVNIVEETLSEPWPKKHPVPGNI